MSEVLLDPARWESLEAGDSALLECWLAAEGDHVRMGQVLAKVALVHERVDVEAPHHGILEQICIPAGNTFKRGEVLAYVVRF